MLNERIDKPTPMELVKMTMNRSDWDSKTPFQKYCYLYGIGGAALSVLGFPVFTEDPRCFWYSYVFFIYMAIDAVLVLYTGYYYLLRGDLYSFLPCTAPLIGPLCSVGCCILFCFSLNICQRYQIIFKTLHWDT